MKGIIASALGIQFLLSLTACGNSTVSLAESSSKQTPNDILETSSTGLDTVSGSSSTDETKTLIVYFSASGNTKKVANVIAGKTGGDLFELEPVDPYSKEDLDWTAEDSRVNHEHDDKSLKSVELVNTSVENWDTYSTVFIGYPIWWGSAAWPVNEFITSNNFSGKTIIPFCTSASSGIGESATLLSEMAGTGNWQDGYRFSSNASDSEIFEWLSTLKY